MWVKGGCEYGRGEAEEEENATSKGEIEEGEFVEIVKGVVLRQIKNYERA